MQRISFPALLRNPLLSLIRASVTAMLLALLVLPAAARSRHHASSHEDAPGSFDYYLLSLSWAPNFCATHSGSANECGTGRHIAFVLHGLWPQDEQGRLDQPCQHTSPVAQDVVRYALNFYPAAGLVQHEWQCHGVYSGLSAQDYFTAAGRAFQSLHIPAALTANSANSANSEDTQQNAATLVQQFEQSNAAPRGSFVSSCHDGELVAIEACFTKDLKLRSCSPNLHSCSGPLLLRAPH